VPQYDMYSDTTNIKYTLWCTRPSKIVTNGVGVPDLGVSFKGLYLIFYWHQKELFFVYASVI